MALGAVLAVLGLPAVGTEQPGSGVLVGAVAPMAPSLSPPDPDARHRWTTTALLAAGAAAAGLTAGLLLVPHRLAGDVGLVLLSAEPSPVVRATGRAARHRRAGGVSERAGDVGRRLQELRTRSRPPVEGFAGHGWHGLRRGLEVLEAYTHYARELGRLSTAGPLPADPSARAALAAAADRVHRNVAALAERVVPGPATVRPADDLLDAAERPGRTDLRHQDDGQALRAVRALRRLDAAVVGLARELGPAASSGAGSRSLSGPATD